MSKNKQEMNVEVFVRVRPLTESERGSEEIVETLSKRVVVKLPESKGSRKEVDFDGCFGPHVSQVEVYDSVVGNMVSDVLAGYNCTVFAYGQTGTGKTFTMEGCSDYVLQEPCEDDPSWGILPRASRRIFDEIMNSTEESVIRVSHVEIYNEDVFDLLSSSKEIVKLRIFEDSGKKGSSTLIQNLEEVTVTNKNELLRVLRRSSEKRQKAHTLLNANSSRSHSIFTISVSTKEISLDGSEILKCGKLNLVDLAGSENIARSGSAESRKARGEAASINQSLLTLGRVISSIVSKAIHIPYRESKLTRLLQDSLGGSTRTAMIATISPSSVNLEDTLNTLDYAARAKRITNRPAKNVKLSKEILLKDYMNEIEQLRKELLTARRKSGVYLPLEQFNEMKEKLDKNAVEYRQKLLENKELKEEKQRITINLNALERENERMKKMLIEKELEWKEKEEEQICENERIKKILKEKELEWNKKEEEQMHLMTTFYQDCLHLHNKVDRNRKLNDWNNTVISSFHRYCQGFQDKISGTFSDSVRKVEDLQKMLSNAADNAVIMAESIKQINEKVKTQEESMVNAINAFQSHLENQGASSETLIKQVEEVEKFTSVYKQDIEDTLQSFMNWQDAIITAGNQNIELKNSISSLEESIQDIFLESFKAGESAIAEALYADSKKQEKAIKSSEEMLLCLEDTFKALEVFNSKMLNLRSLSKNNHENLTESNVNCTRTAAHRFFNSTKIYLEDLSEKFKSILDKTESTSGFLHNQVTSKVSANSERLVSSQEKFSRVSEALTSLRNGLLQKEKFTPNLIPGFSQDKVEEVSKIYEGLETLNFGGQKHVELNRQCSTTTELIANSYSDLQNNMNEIARRISSFVREELKKDVPTGETPEKRLFEFRRSSSSRSSLFGQFKNGK